MRKLSCINLFVLLIVFLLYSLTISSQELITPQLKISHKKTPLNIPHVYGEIKLDGEPRDLLWSKALTVELDIVNKPWDNLPSPIETKVKLIDNGEFLYVFFEAIDPEPEKIHGFLTARDNAWFHDLVGIKLDTHNNRRLNYEFFVNPFGVQNDATYSEITDIGNTSWDGLWYAFGKKTTFGYQVEIAIPYNILNFKNNNKVKEWAIELVRIYPRDTSLRISHVPLNRDNNCWLCQYPEAIGFKNIDTSKNLRLTPTITATRNDSRDIYSTNENMTPKWISEDDIDTGLELRWGINANNLLNATINPDFSNVESDSGQLSANTNFSLYFEEKRAFFLDNSDYFNTDFNLVYTRNIADPVYGAKLTGRVNEHSYGFFTTKDSETNILIPGNLESNLTRLQQDNISSVLRHRYDFNENLTIGSIGTIRESDDYHNYVFGLDARYRLSHSSALKTQFLRSDTLYTDTIISNGTINTFGLNHQIDHNQLNDKAYKINFNHDSENWLLNLEHKYIGANFRADLGYMPKVDIKTDQALIKRTFYLDQLPDWQKAGISGEWKKTKNVNNELIEKELIASFSIEGPFQSQFEFDYIHAERVGLRFNENLSDIDGNTSLFNENQIQFTSSAFLNNRTYLSFNLNIGDKVDYLNNRLGDLIESTGNLTIFVTDHLEFDFSQTYSKLDATEDEHKINVYIANISELRLSYQFDVYSYLKLSLIHNNVEYLNEEPMKDLSTKLIYAYKLNPQTVFFLGYSDNSYQDLHLAKLTRADRVFFTKISYAWII